MKDVRWLEVGIFFKPQFFSRRNIHWMNSFLLDDIPYYSWHYFSEPNHELRFRLLGDKKTRDEVRKRIKQLKSRDKFHDFIRKVTYRRYYGEKGLYGELGFGVANRYFADGAMTAWKLIDLDNKRQLTSPHKKWSPIHFHMNRYVHLFANQLGYSVWDEFKWALKYAWNRLVVWVYYKKQGVKGR